jgi:hypothetical protein
LRCLRAASEHHGIGALMDAAREEGDKLLKLRWYGWVLLMIAAICPLLSAQSKLPAADRERLMRYVNTYDSDKLLADPIVKPRLAELLGSELAHLKKNLDVRGPIGVVGGMLTLSGNAPHQGLLENGFVGVSLYNGAVYACILSRGRIDVYGREQKYQYLPDAVRDWIVWAWATPQLNGRAPSNVVLHPQAP